jgi:hypothetical protein
MNDEKCGEQEKCGTNGLCNIKLNGCCAYETTWGIGMELGILLVLMGVVAEWLGYVTLFDYGRLGIVMMVGSLLFFALALLATLIIAIVEWLVLRRKGAKLEVRWRRGE